MQEGFAIAEIIWDDAKEPYDFRFLEINNAFGRMAGFVPDAVTGKTILQLFPQVDPGWLAIFRDVASRQKPVKLEKFSPNLNKWFSFHMFCPEKDRIAALFIDISEQKQAEQALRQNERRLSLAIAATQEAVWEWNLMTQETYFSPRWYEMLGYKDGEISMTFEGWKKLCHPEDFQPTMDLIQSRLKSPDDSGYAAEFRMRTKDGSWRWILGRGKVVERNAAGDPVILSGINTDISDRKRMEEKLKESEKWFRTLSDCMPQLVWTANPDGGVDYYNIRYKQYRGIARQPDGTFTWSPVLHSEDQAPTIAAWQHAYRTGETYQIEHRVQDANGDYRWHLSRAIPIRDSEGRIIKWFGTATDIDNVKQTELTLQNLTATLEQKVAERTELAETRTRQLQSLVSELTLAEQRERGRLAEVLHDHLQQFLVAAKLNCEMLCSQVNPDLRDAADKITDLIIQAIDTSRSLTAELSPPFLKQNRLSAALKWLASWMKEKQGLGIDLQIAPNSDPKQEDITVLLFQSIRELLFNVVKHSGIKSSRLEMARDDENRLWVSVIDQGVGFEPDTIWDLARHGKGSGLLGVRERLALFGGSLEVESSPGNGATFSLVVPLEPHQRAHSL